MSALQLAPVRSAVRRREVLGAQALLGAARREDASPRVVVVAVPVTCRAAMDGAALASCPASRAVVRGPRARRDGCWPAATRSGRRGSRRGRRARGRPARTRGRTTSIWRGRSRSVTRPSQYSSSTVGRRGQPHRRREAAAALGGHRHPGARAAAARTPRRSTSRRGRRSRQRPATQASPRSCASVEVLAVLEHRTEGRAAAPRRARRGRAASSASDPVDRLGDARAASAGRACAAAAPRPRPAPRASADARAPGGGRCATARSNGG